MLTPSPAAADCATNNCSMLPTDTPSSPSKRPRYSAAEAQVHNALAVVLAEVQFTKEERERCIANFQRINGMNPHNNTNANPVLVDVTGQENTPPSTAVPPIAARNLAATLEEAAPVAFNPKAFETGVDKQGNEITIPPSTARTQKQRAVDNIEAAVKAAGPTQEKQVVALHGLMTTREIAQPVLEAIQKGAGEGEDIDVLGNIKEMMELFQTKALTKDGTTFRKN